MLSLSPSSPLATETVALTEIQCPICLEEIVADDCSLLDCDHELCKPCLDTLFAMNTMNCPLCRKDIESFTYKEQVNRIVIIRPRLQGPRLGRRRTEVVYINRTSVYMTIFSAGTTICFIGSMIVNIYLYAN